MLVGIWFARSPVKREAIALRDQPTVGEHVWACRRCELRLTMFVLGSCDRRVRRCPVRARATASRNPPTSGRARPRDLRDAHRRRHRLALGAGARRRVLRRGCRHFLQRLDHRPCSATRSASTTRSSTARCWCSTMIFVPEGLVGIGRRIKAATPASHVEPERRTWLSDLFGITKPPVKLPVTDGDAERAPRRGRAPRARAAAASGAASARNRPSSRPRTSASASVASSRSTA